MARVICTLPNASTKINGVAFAEDRGQMVSEEISDDKAAAFVAIPGYKLVGDKKAAAKDATPAPGGDAKPDPQQK